MTVKEVIRVLDELAPSAYQESYDNVGLLVGDENAKVTGALCTVDVTEEVLDEAIQLKANLIISHHPIIFGTIKKLTNASPDGRLLLHAIKNDIAVYAAHTNLDNISRGVNYIIGQKLGLINTKILEPSKGLLYKVVTFVPSEHAQAVREAMFTAGAGHIGNYDSCSYNIIGEGTFRGNEKTNPFAGDRGNLHTETEVRIETIVPKPFLNKIINEMIVAHPYEEVAYDVYPLENIYPQVGAGMIGELSEPVSHTDFLHHLKATFNVPVIRFAGKQRASYRKIAYCGGSGSFLIDKAIHSGADIFLTGDLKYHQFFETQDRILLCDIGHYESEQFTKEIFYSVLTKNFSTFAVHLTSIVTNPIKYFL